MSYKDVLKKDGEGSGTPCATEAKQELILEAVGGGSDYVVSAVYHATIGASQVLGHASAFNCILPATLKRIVLIPRGDVYWNIGTDAAATTAKVPTGGLSMPVTKTLADTIEVYAANVECDLLVCVPR